MHASTASIVNERFDNRNALISSQTSAPKLYRCLLPLLEQRADPNNARSTTSVIFDTTRSAAQLKASNVLACSVSSFTASTADVADQEPHRPPTLDELTRLSWLRCTPNDCALTVDLEHDEFLRTLSKRRTEPSREYISFFEQESGGNSHEAGERTTHTSGLVTENVHEVDYSDQIPHHAVGGLNAEQSDEDLTVNNDDDQEGIIIQQQNLVASTTGDNKYFPPSIRIIKCHMPNAIILAKFVEQVQLLFDCCTSSSFRYKHWSSERKRRHLQASLRQFTQVHGDSSTNSLEQRCKWKVLLCPSDPNLPVNAQAAMELDENTLQSYIGLHINGTLECWAFGRVDDDNDDENVGLNSKKSLLSGLAGKISIELKNSAVSVKNNIVDVVAKLSKSLSQ